jgi:hypothetical protein
MKTIKIFTILLLTLPILVCTKNPFFKDKELTGNFIKGKVTLAGQLPASNAFVWLEGYNASAFADQNGEFYLDLSATSPLGGNMMGQYNLYFYVNNYQLDSAAVVFVNGSVQSSEGDLNKKYELNRIIQLSKALDITVEIKPSVIASNFNDSLFLTVYLTALLDTINITTQIRGPLDLSAVFIKKSASSNDDAQLINQGGSIYSTLPIFKISYNRHFNMSIPFNASEYSAGNYEITPYLMVTPDKIPNGLLKNLIQDYKKLSLDFLRVPIARNGGTLQIVK